MAADATFVLKAGVWFRLCYRDPNQRFKVVIMEAASLISARLKATLAARDASIIFTEELKREIAR